MDRMFVNGEGLPADAPPQVVLAPAQQAALDCAACFLRQGRLIQTNDIVACRESPTGTIRSALNALDNQGLVVNTTPGSETRKNFYAPTVDGVRVAAESSPECVVVNRDKPKLLPPSVQKTLNCVACLADCGLTATRSAVTQCENGPDNLNTTGVALNSLAKQGYITMVGPKEDAAYDITPVGADHAATPKKDCAVAAELASPVGGLTQTQQTVLDCLRCQVAQGIVPDRQRTTLCTGQNDQRVRKAAAKLASRGLITVHNSEEKPGLRSEGLVQSYKPQDVRTFGPKRQPDCTIADKELQGVYDRLSDVRKRILRCLVCVEDRIASGASFPGANALLVSQCTDFPEGTTQQFMRQLATEGYFDSPTTGFSRITGHGRVFYRPSVKGKALYALHREHEFGPSADCSVDINALDRVPVHIRNAVIKCIGCLWTQAVAGGQKPTATAGMIAQCTGLDRSNITESVLPGLVADGYLEQKPGAVRGFCYGPSDMLRIPLGRAADCKLNICNTEGLTEQLLAISDGIISHQSEADEFADFQEYVAGLKDVEVVAGLEYTLLGNLATTFPLLTAEEEAYLGMVIQTSGDAEAVEKAIFKFVASNVRLATWMARKRIFETSITSHEETTQAALMGVYHAVKNFNPQLGNKFSSYCYQRMRGEIERATGRAFGVPAYIFTDIPVLIWQMRTFKDEHGRNPSTVELATVSGRSLKQVEKVLAAYVKVTQRHDSLDETTSEDSSQQRHEKIGETDANLEMVETADLFTKLRLMLSPRDLAILDKVVLGGIPAVQFAENNRLDLQLVRYVAQDILSMLRHPYFGIGKELDVEKFGWQERAQCAAEGREDVVRFGVTPYKQALCGRCAVRSECADFAASTKPEVTTGIWGGSAPYFVPEADDES